jgi:isopenicillin N synthase-like dioxygenase
MVGVDSAGPFVPTDAMCDSLISDGYVIIDGLFADKDFHTFTSSARELFKQPDSTRHLAKGPFDSGFHPIGRSKMRDGGVPNYVESWMFDCSAGSQNTDYLTPQATQSMVSMGVALKSAATSLMGKLDSRFEFLSPLAQSAQTQGTRYLILRYPAFTDAPRGARRQGWHADSGYVSVLPAASSRGLVIESGGQVRWLDLGEDECLVMAGEALQVATEGRIQALRHTVEGHNEAGECLPERFSAVYFAVPQKASRLGLVSGEKSISSEEQSEKYFRPIFGSDALHEREVK